MLLVYACKRCDDINLILIVILCRRVFTYASTLTSLNDAEPQSASCLFSC